MAYIGEAIKSINPDAKFLVRREGSNSNAVDNCTIEWFEGTTPIPKEELKTKLTELQAEYDAQEYARKRQAEYPATKDFVEAYTEKEIGGDSTKWDAYVINYNKVRTDNPKE